MGQQFNTQEWEEHTEVFRRLRGDAVGAIEHVLARPLALWQVAPDGANNQVDTGKNESSIDLLTGEQITLHTLHQFPSYDGMLSGWPHPYWAIDNALTHVREHFAHIDITPVILEPMLQQGYDTEGLPKTLAAPPVCCVGLFESKTAVHDGDWSCALLVWFQDRMGLDMDTHTLKQARQLNWATIAVGCTF